MFLLTRIYSAFSKSRDFTMMTLSVSFQLDQTDSVLLQILPSIFGEHSLFWKGAIAFHSSCLMTKTPSVFFKLMWTELVLRSLRVVWVWWSQFLMAFSDSFFSKSRDFTKWHHQKTALFKLAGPWLASLSYSPCRKGVMSLELKSCDPTIMTSLLSFKLIWTKYFPLCLSTIQIRWP